MKTTNFHENVYINFTVLFINLRLYIATAGEWKLHSRKKNHPDVDLYKECTTLELMAINKYAQIKFNFDFIFFYLKKKSFWSNQLNNIKFMLINVETFQN